MGFCLSGVLSVPHVVSWASTMFKKNNFQVLLAVKIVVLITFINNISMFEKSYCN